MSYVCLASHVALVIKNPPANAGDVRDAHSIPGLRRSPGEGNGNPLQYSCLENPTDRGAWWAPVHRVSQNGTRLKQLAAPCLRNSQLHMLGFSGDTDWEHFSYTLERHMWFLLLFMCSKVLWFTVSRRENPASLLSASFT